MAGANGAHRKAAPFKASQVEKVRAAQGANVVAMARTFRAPAANAQGASGVTLAAKSLARAAAKLPTGKPPGPPQPFTWKRGADGNYAASDGRARLVKTGKKWQLVARDGTRHDMPKKASFDHAEGLIVRHSLR